MAQTTNDIEVLSRMETKLEQIVRLLAFHITSGMKNQGEAIQFLNSLGFDRKTIADTLRTTPNTVSVTLARAKAKRAAKPEREPEP